MSKSPERASKIQVGPSAKKYAGRCCHDLQNPAAEIAAAAEDFNIVDSYKLLQLHKEFDEPEVISVTGAITSQLLGMLCGFGACHRICSILP
jgi:hypothetical protein